MPFSARLFFFILRLIQVYIWLFHFPKSFNLTVGLSPVHFFCGIQILMEFFLSCDINVVHRICNGNWATYFCHGCSYGIWYEYNLNRLLISWEEFLWKCLAQAKCCYIHFINVFGKQHTEYYRLQGWEGEKMIFFSL